MSNIKKLMMSAAGGGESVNVEDVFSTYLYTGTGSTQTITNGIDLDGEGGMVWIKGRDSEPFSNNQHVLFDTARGGGKSLYTDLSNPEGSEYGSQSFTSSGFTIPGNGPYSSINSNSSGGIDYASWTFRKAPKFFDVVKYSYQGNAGGTSAQIPHNLGTAPSFIMIKAIDKNENFICWHKDINGYLKMGTQGTDALFTGTNAFGSLTPSMTDTHFTVGYDGGTNFPGYTYVAYLFAHNDGDGEFGADGDQDIIKCGSYTGNGNYLNGKYVDVGFEPQWILQKAVSTTGPWLLLDIMRGWDVNTGNKPRLLANATNAEALSDSGFALVSGSGFTIYDTSSKINGNGQTYIYMAIRRGTKVPESGTEVFEPTAYTGDNTANRTVGGLTIDMNIIMDRTKVAENNNLLFDRMRGQDVVLKTDTTGGDGNGWGGTYYNLDQQHGFSNGSDTSFLNNSSGNYISYIWKRAPGFFDVVAYTGDGVSTRLLNHNLGAQPELIISKLRSTSDNWQIMQYDPNITTTTGTLKLFHQFSTSAALYTGTINGTYGPNAVAPTASTYQPAYVSGNSNQVNTSGQDYIAYLFASLDGISKVGRFSHTSGTPTNVDCGFTNGARFVLWKKYSSTDGWQVYDTARGIVTGNDPFLQLNSTAAEITNEDLIDPLSSGFTVTANKNSGDYIFYAIA